MIRSIIEQTGVKIDVEDSGKVNVASNDEVSANKALQIIRDLTASAEVGKTYLGKVSRLADFGAFVEIIPGTDGLLHISEVAEHRIKDVRDELKEGDQVLVKVLAVEGNRIKLSRKAILKEQRAKMGGAPVPETGDDVTDPGLPAISRSAPQAEGQGSPTAVIEGGADFDADDEPNFNRVDGVVASVEASAARPEGTREGRPSGGGDVIAIAGDAAGVVDAEVRGAAQGAVREVTVVATRAAVADAVDARKSALENHQNEINRGRIAAAFIFDWDQVQ